MIALDVNLSWLIAKSGIEKGPAHRRLYAIENQLIYLARPWRTRAPIDPARELRMSRATRQQLIAWVGAKESQIINLPKRIAEYESLLLDDETVADSWIRFVLAAAPFST
ncbi:MAG: hypothetical protein V4550_20175 [Gemmatimonadota bacterium]